MPEYDNQNIRNEERIGGEVERAQVPTQDSGEVSRAEGERHSPETAAESMGLSVTPHRQIPLVTGNDSKNPDNPHSGTEDWVILSHGIDSLDLGLGVTWGDDWTDICLDLERGKQEASGHKQVPWRRLAGEQTYIFPSGRPQYRFHLLCSVGQVYIGIAAKPKKNPNIYLSFHAWCLWVHGWQKCLHRVAQIVRELGGAIRYILPSRIDLCVDCHVPGGLTQEFLDKHLVAWPDQTSQNRTRQVLETYYLGSKKNPMQLRIYDKTKKAIKDDSLPLFQEVWGKPLSEDVWRIEFQIRRPFLNEYGIETMGGLRSCLKAIWEYLTQVWCSLRFQDNPKSSRRTVMPLWVAIQDSFQSLPGQLPLQKKDKSLQLPALEWYVARIDSFLITFGARRGHKSIKTAYHDLTATLQKRKTVDQYNAALELKLTELGRIATQFKENASDGWREV